MGDHNVPNAHFFADKYTQVYRITLPICNTLAKIPELMKKPSLRKFVEEEFGSEENLMVEILGDFFRHGFDGSGADNFFDAGSCIDGNLTQQNSRNPCSCDLQDVSHQHGNGVITSRRSVSSPYSC